ncbi:zinc-dependent metalloprotease [Sphingobacterium lumbrici]|uniref:zinc-dependent metalloprotease n=1 Tax=Sphingobacterium lumbrici TaxID=2559600 RepID=UPI0015E2828A|nr:zinc-dependent metalloprotease [Sphingobacterium lumbrici]
MKLKFIPVLGVALFSAATGFAQDSTAVNKPTTTTVAKVKPYKEVITDKAITKSGLFKVHNIDTKYFFEIPDDLLSREFLFTTRLSKVPTGSPRFGGDLMNAIIVTFEKAPGDKLFIRAVVNADQSEDTNELAKAVRNSTVAPIIMSLDVKARTEDNNATVIDMTDFFLKDNLISGFHASAKKQMGTGAPAADRSALLSMEAFPLNIEIKSMKTYSLGAAPKPDGEAGAATPPPASAGVTFEISNSVMVLPKQMMQVQVFDPRVGFKGSSTAIFTDEQQKVDKRQFIVKNRLEIRPEDLAAYKAGKLVEPKEPLVYYIDPATPKQYRKYMIAGINNWNEAFKAAGFKNAIIGKEWPENDPSMNMEDARYRVIRYMPSTSPFLDNNIVTDPRTGEIVQTHIGWSHSQVKTLHDWYMVQAGASDPGARTMKFSEELIGSLITAEISRTIGFTLGLSENLGSSFTIPLERLRDKAYLAKHPYNNSIMDYNHYNYVAQPEDKISRNGLIPQVGEYDKWAIKWGYSYTGTSDFESDKKIRLKWIAQHVKEGADLQFLGQDAGVRPVDITDPSAQWEDLSNNPVKAAEYGIQNLKYVMKNLVPWTTTDDNTYFNTSDIYYTLVNQHSFLMRIAYTQVGGVYVRIKRVNEPGDVYIPVPKEVQRAAVAFLNKEAFNTPDWILEPSVLNKFRKPAKKEEVTRMQDETLHQLISPSRLFRMNVATMRFGKENTYTVEELLKDLTDGIFAEVIAGQTVDGNKRFMQKTLVSYLLSRLADTEVIPDPTKENLLVGTDVAVVLRAHLELLKEACDRAVSRYSDPIMQSHVKYMAGKIEHALNPKN